MLLLGPTINTNHRMVHWAGEKFTFAFQQFKPVWALRTGLFFFSWDKDEAVSWRQILLSVDMAENSLGWYSSECGHDTTNLVPFHRHKMTWDTSNTQSQFFTLWRPFFFPKRISSSGWNRDICVFIAHVSKISCYALCGPEEAGSEVRPRLLVLLVWAACSAFHSQISWLTPHTSGKIICMGELAEACLKRYTTVIATACLRVCP